MPEKPPKKDPQIIADLGKSALDALIKEVRQSTQPSGISFWTPTLSLSPTLSPLTPIVIPSEEEHQLTREIGELREQLAREQRALLAVQEKSGKTEKNLAQVKATLTQLQKKEALGFVLNRIHPDARTTLLEKESFSNLFLGNSSCDAYVVSIDIRRSTELMLKARKPEQYAEFISRVCTGLRDIILDHHGVFDKFTGDGILAFFPDFYSGTDSGYYAVSAADACHTAFQEFYSSSRNCFVSILKDIGLGIGIDYGRTHLVQIGDGLTVVGTPVVYACRMAGSAPGSTLLNQPAYEHVFGRYSAFCGFEEQDLDVKHEGSTVAYRVFPNGKPYSPAPPKWREFVSDKPEGTSSRLSVASG